MKEIINSYFFDCFKINKKDSEKDYFSNSFLTLNPHNKNGKKLNDTFRKKKSTEKDEKGKVGKAFVWRRNL